MKIFFSRGFEKQFNKIRNRELQDRVIKAIKKLEENPDVGRPLRHTFKNHRRLVVSPYRIIYRIEPGRILVNCFEHRNKSYRKHQTI